VTALVETREPIKVSDRCDQCGAAAMVRATLKSGELYFCGHHGREVSEKLILQAIEVYDPEGVFNYGK
jgi:ribosomal protein S14